MNKLNNTIQKKEWTTPSLLILNVKETKSGTKQGKENQGNVQGNNSNSKLIIPR